MSTPQAKEFPAVQQLGYGINMLSVTPLGVDAVTKAIITTRRLVTYDEYDTRDLTVDGTLYAVPKTIGVLESGANPVDRNSLSFVNGNDAYLAFKDDSRLPLLYFTVTGTPSVGAATYKLFRTTNQYAFYCYVKYRFVAQLRDYVDSLNVKWLTTKVKKLPGTFDGKKAEDVKSYRDFFEDVGTHVITKVQHGSRLLLQSWEETDHTVSARWGEYVDAYYGGIPKDGQSDISSITGEPAYKNFMAALQYYNSVQGGDAQDKIIIAHDYDKFLEWTKTIDHRPVGLSGLVVTDLWSLMRDSGDDYLAAAAPRLNEAYDFISSNPPIHITEVVFTIESDWAEFGLLTPSAQITSEEKSQGSTYITETKVSFGKEYSHKYERKTITFNITNDGYPVDFYISHGSEAGGAGTQGTARVVMENQHYENKTNSDNVYNTQWFFRAPVNRNAKKFALHGNYGLGDAELKMHPWDLTLKKYLEQMGE